MAEQADCRKTWALIERDDKPYQSDVPGTLGGHCVSKIDGRFDCRTALQAIERGGYVKHRVSFLDEDTAITAGYRPCGVCQPEKYAAWKAKQAPKTTKKMGRK